jgi:hypothetical protein
VLKIFLSFLLVAATSNGFAEETVKTIKECKVSFTSLLFNKNVKMDIKVTQGNDQKLIGKVSQEIDGFSGSFSGSTTVKTYVIRENLLSHSKEKDLNEGESLIVHSEELINEPSFDGRFKAGVDLNNIRNVRLYLIGKKTIKGSTVVVEAWDDQQNNLGSFLGGNLLSPCITTRTYF